MKNQIKRRLSASFIDIILLFTILYFYAIAYNGFTIYANLPVNGYHILLIIYGYPIIQEFIFKTTIGKRMYRIRVDLEERNIQGFIQIVLRNLINLFEIMIPLIYLIPILFSNKKVGDYFSKINLMYD
ncbi:RDD family protein [uncultured Aquimarina sp.]|uniref:RDD family protein n=1 Tax=uncultured Aquimarina sp. TaxID=575652 RepID=UPI002603D360|nr:RDD family protein [uncultured Aquimarina sp.]